MMKIANAPCSWGILEFDLDGDSQNGGSDGCEQVLSEMRQTGYQGTELGDWGFMPVRPGPLKKILKQYDLELPGAFVPVRLADRDSHDEGEAAALRTARLLAGAAGNGACIVLSDDNGTDEIRTKNAGRIFPSHEMNERQWKNFIDGMHRIARAVREETGLATVFHHHCAGFIETPHEIEKMLDRTDPELIGLCLDTGHYCFGGGDPVEAIRRHSGRIRHVHFKDYHPGIGERSRNEGWDYFKSIENGVFCELGKGIVDFPAVLSGLRGTGYIGWIVVEQDILPGMGAPLESARRNRDYLRSIGL